MYICEVKIGHNKRYSIKKILKLKSNLSNVFFFLNYEDILHSERIEKCSGF